MPIGGKIIQVNGVAVSSRTEIVGQLKTAGAGPVAFTCQSALFTGLATVHITKDKAKGFGMHISDEGVVECFSGGAAKVRRMHAPPLTRSSRAARWRWQRPATSDLHASNRRSSKERRFHPFEGRMDSRITQVPITQTALH
eukprot:COSAG06_NODE_782_length_12363_cov_27.005463_10_plen_141_part_00